MTDDVPPTLCFGIFEADVRSGELRRRGVRVRLQFQPFLVLRTLLEQAGEVVTREDLRRAIWPKALFVDFEMGLNRAVSKLRRALGDTARNPRFVETLPHVGYRFVAPVARRESGIRFGDRSRRWSCYLAWSGRESLLFDGTNVIGRAEDADVRIDEDTVSRRHARIVVKGKSAVLEDLGSRNGTFVQGHPVEEPRPLANGSEIRFGSLPVLFRMASPSRTTRPARQS
jgi:DNA-binding winged helix-turn-helix (wHTH) protein